MVASRSLRNLCAHHLATGGILLHMAVIESQMHLFHLQLVLRLQKHLLHLELDRQLPVG